MGPLTLLDAGLRYLEKWLPVGATRNDTSLGNRPRRLVGVIRFRLEIDDRPTLMEGTRPLLGLQWQSLDHCDQSLHDWRYLTQREELLDSL